MSAETLVADLADRGEPLAESSDAYSCYLEVDTDEHRAIIVWVEPLAFHASWNNYRKWQARPATDRWSQHVDGDGWLTPGAEDALKIRLAEMLPKSEIGDTVDTIDYGGDEPTITFEIVTSYEDGETFSHWYDRIGWPIVATLISVTDPGTFNSPYLFDMSSL